MTPMDRIDIPLRLRYLSGVIGTAFKSLGVSAADRLARTLARGVHELNLPLQRQIEENLHFLPAGNGTQNGERLSRQVFENAAAFWVELLYCRRLLSPGAWRKCVSIDDEERWARLTAGPQPTIFLTGYFGNPVIGACAISELAGPVHVTVDPLSRMLIHAGGGMDSRFRGLRVLESERVGQRAPTLLKSGGKLLMLAGGPPRDGGVQVRFLGRERRFQATAARLALRHQARIVVFACRRRDDGIFRFDLSLAEVIRPNGRPSSAASLTQRYLEAMERFILPNPEQYLWTR